MLCSSCKCSSVKKITITFYDTSHQDFEKIFFLPPVVRPGLTWVTLEDALVLKQILTMGRMWRLAGRHITSRERSKAGLVMASLLSLAALSEQWVLTQMEISGHSVQERRWGRRKQETTNCQWNTARSSFKTKSKEKSLDFWWQTVGTGGLHASSHDPILSTGSEEAPSQALYMDHHQRQWLSTSAIPTGRRPILWIWKRRLSHPSEFPVHPVGRCYQPTALLSYSG